LCQEKKNKTQRQFRPLCSSETMHEFSKEFSLRYFGIRVAANCCVAKTAAFIILSDTQHTHTYIKRFSACRCHMALPFPCSFHLQIFICTFPPGTIYPLPLQAHTHTQTLRAFTFHLPENLANCWPRDSNAALQMWVCKMRRFSFHFGKNASLQFAKTQPKCQALQAIWNK